MTTYLTTIPLHRAAPGGKWSWNRPARQAHRDVMSLFSQLDGKRSEYGILFRLDEMSHMSMSGHRRDGRSLLVRSTVFPDLQPGALTGTISDQIKTITEEPVPPAGTPLIFQVGLNAIRRSDANGERPIAAEQLSAWATHKLEPGLDIKGFTGIRNRTVDGPSGGRLRITHASGVATVRDAAELDRLRRHGVGRAKNYGAGLLTWTEL